MTLNGWDFGGQEIYHATHQFFLTERSLYLIVWNAREGYELSRLRHWLDRVQTLAPDSRVLLVATWTDERAADLPLAELKVAYPQIVDNFPVSNKTSAGIEQLRETIIDEAAAMRLMGGKWPVKWLKVSHTIHAKAEKRKHISKA